MYSAYIAIGVLIIYFLYKSAWMVKSIFIDSTENNKSSSTDKAYGKETFIMLAICLAVLWIGKEFNF